MDSRDLQMYFSGQIWTWKGHELNHLVSIFPFLEVTLSGCKMNRAKGLILLNYG